MANTKFSDDEMEAIWQFVAEPSNLVLLCAKCHSFVHGKKNVDREFLSDDSGGQNDVSTD